MSDQPATPDDQTEEAERAEMTAPHQPDRMPTPEEEEAAPSEEDLDPKVTEHSREMDELGANVKGEGEIP
jgi:hypothetical protein